VKRFNHCVTRTGKNPNFTTGAKPTHDYDTLATKYQLTPDQLTFIAQTVGWGEGKTGDGEQQYQTLLSPTRVGDNNCVITTGPLASLPPRVHQNAAFLDALMVQREVNRLKGEAGLRFTHAQILEIIRVRHEIEIHPVQFQRVKKRFCSMPRDGLPYHHASVVGLIVETLKGTKGLPSEYTVSPILDAVLE
jgi:hypothetical protein